MTDTRPYAGRSLTERRALRRQRVLRAGLECLHEQGLPGISVRTVCARSGLTDRYFYESFANLDALLVGMVDAITDELTQAGLASSDRHRGDLPAQVRDGIAAAFAVVLRDPRKSTVLLTASAYSPMQTRLQEHLLEFAELLATTVLDGIAVPHALRLRALFLIGGVLELISAHLSGLVEIDEDELTDQCAELIVDALRIGG